MTTLTPDLSTLPYGTPVLVNGLVGHTGVTDRSLVRVVLPDGIDFRPAWCPRPSLTVLHGPCLSMDQLQVRLTAAFCDPDDER